MVQRLYGRGLSGRGLRRFHMRPPDVDTSSFRPWQFLSSSRVRGGCVDLLLCPDSDKERELNYHESLNIYIVLSAPLGTRLEEPGAVGHESIFIDNSRYRQPANSIL